jgi:hypothetical protein
MIRFEGIKVAILARINRGDKRNILLGGFKN